MHANLYSMGHNVTQLKTLQLSTLQEINKNYIFRRTVGPLFFYVKGDEYIS